MILSSSFRTERSRLLSLQVGSILLVASCLLSVRVPAADDLPLPNWVPSETVKPENTTPPLRSQATPLLPEAPAEDRFDPFKLFIPHSLSQEKVAEAPAPPVIKLQEIEASVLQQANELPDDALLLDPQGLLTETQTEDLRRLLHTHASEALITPRIFVIGRDQVLPKDAKLTGLASGALTEQPSCLVVYPLGDPKRTRLFTSQEISKVTPAGYLAKMSADCVAESEQVSNDVEQLQRFATQLSIRLFWLERAFDFKLKPEETETPTAKIATAQPPALTKAAAEAAAKLKEEAKYDPLPEVVPAPPPTIIPAGTLEKWKIVGGKVAMAAAIGAGSLAAILMLIRWHRRRLRQMVWLLPEVEHVERLGGPHCGGCSAMIKYG